MKNPGCAMARPRSCCFDSEGGNLVLLLTGFLTIPLARQCFLDATLFAWLQVVGVTFDFLDDVFLLNLPLKPAERILKRLAFLYANLCQIEYTPSPAMWLFTEYGILRIWANQRRRNDEVDRGRRNRESIFPRGAGVSIFVTITFIINYLRAILVRFCAPFAHFLMMLKQQQAHLE
jgi:hypothetical protein